MSLYAMRRRSHAAFTLPELMISLSIFSMVVIGIIYVSIFGMRQDMLVNMKLGASASARRAFELLLQDIRGANTLLIGNGTVSSFTAITNGMLQQGTAIQIYPTTNYANYIRYYLDTNTTSLMRVTNGSTATSLVIDHLTNSAYIFQAMDATTNVLMQSPTNLNSHYTVRTVFQVYQFEYPTTSVGNGAYFDYYQMQFRATRRNR